MNYLFGNSPQTQQTPTQQTPSIQSFKTVEEHRLDQNITIVDQVNYDRVNKYRNTLMKHPLNFKNVYDTIGVTPPENQTGYQQLANLVEQNQVKVYGVPLDISLKVDTLPEEIRDVYNLAKVTEVIKLPDFSMYTYPGGGKLAKTGNVFVNFNTSSVNADIAAFSKDVYRLTNVDVGNPGEVYNLLHFKEWRELIIKAFNIGRDPDDTIDVIYDQNLSIVDLKPIAFIAKLKYHDAAKNSLVEYQDNRVFIGFLADNITDEPIGRLNQLANDAYIFLNRSPYAPNVTPEIPERITLEVDKIAAQNKLIQDTINNAVKNRVIEIANQVESDAQIVQDTINNTVKNRVIEITNKVELDAQIVQDERDASFNRIKKQVIVSYGILIFLGIVIFTLISAHAEKKNLSSQHDKIQSFEITN